MTYKLNQFISKILSPTVLMFPNGDKIRYENGDLASSAPFKERYIIGSIEVVDESIVLNLETPETLESTWICEE